MKFHQAIIVAFGALSTLAVGCAVPTGQEDANESATTSLGTDCKKTSSGSTVWLQDSRDAKGRLRLSVKIQDNDTLKETGEGITIEIKDAGVVNGRKEIGSKIIYDLGKLDGVVPTMTIVEGGFAEGASTAAVGRVEFDRAANTVKVTSQGTVSTYKSGRCGVIQG